MKQVKVTITGKQYDKQGEETVLELVSVGRYYHKAGIDYVTYQETEVSGMEGTTTLLKIYSDYVVLIRTGSVEQKMVFQLGHTHSGSYITPYGRFFITVITKELNVNITQDDLGKIEIHYDIKLDGEWVNHNILTVKVREDNRYGNERTGKGSN